MLEFVSDLAGPGVISNSDGLWLLCTVENLSSRSPQEWSDTRGSLPSKAEAAASLAAADGSLGFGASCGLGAGLGGSGAGFGGSCGAGFGGSGAGLGGSGVGLGGSCGAGLGAGLGGS